MLRAGSHDVNQKRRIKAKEAHHQHRMNENNTKTVLIAGATGYLGRHLVAEYMERGWNVIALARRKEGAPGFSASNRA